MSDIDDLVYKALSRTEWKTLSKVQREIGSEASLGEIYLAADKGEHEGWIESRPMDGDRREFKLKVGGVRKTKCGERTLGWFGWLPVRA